LAKKNVHQPWPLALKSCCQYFKNLEKMLVAATISGSSAFGRSKPRKKS